MSLAIEIDRLESAKKLLVLKMVSAGYEVPEGATINDLIYSITLKSVADWNILPDTDTWQMYNGKVPAVCGGYRFEHTFDDVWGGYYYHFSSEFLELIRGKTVALGISSLTGNYAKIEMVCDDKLVIGIMHTDEAKESRYTVPEDITKGYIRAVVFGKEDLHCAFEGIYMKIVS